MSAQMLRLTADISRSSLKSHVCTRRFMSGGASALPCHICPLRHFKRAPTQSALRPPSGSIQLLFMYCLICSNLKALFSVSLVFAITILACVCVCNCLVKVVPGDL